MRNSNPEVVEVYRDNGKLFLTPRNIGISTITFTRSIKSNIIYNPLAEFTSEAVAVTIT